MERWNSPRDAGTRGHTASRRHLTPRLGKHLSFPRGPPSGKGLCLQGKNAAHGARRRDAIWAVTDEPTRGSLAFGSAENKIRPLKHSPCPYRFTWWSSLPQISGKTLDPLSKARALGLGAVGHMTHSSAQRGVRAKPHRAHVRDASRKGLRLQERRRVKTESHSHTHTVNASSSKPEDAETGQTRAEVKTGAPRSHSHVAASNPVNSAWARGSLCRRGAPRAITGAVHDPGT